MGFSTKLEVIHWIFFKRDVNMLTWYAHIVATIPRSATAGRIEMVFRFGGGGIAEDAKILLPPWNRS